MNIEQKFIDSFRCPKCNGQAATTRKVNITASNLSKFLPIHPGKYLFVTCTLCGYTEIYDLAVYAKKEAAEKAKAKLANTEG